MAELLCAICYYAGPVNADPTDEDVRPAMFVIGGVSVCYDHKTEVPNPDFYQWIRYEKAMKARL